MKMFAKLTASMTLCIGISSTAFAAEPIHNWNFATNVSESSMVFQVAALFKKSLESRSDGRIKVNLYPSGQIGKDKEIAEGVIAGNITGGSFNPASFSSYLPDAAVFDLFDTFESRKHARAVFDGALTSELVKSFGTIDVKPLAFVEVGFRNLMSNKEVASIADIKGQKIRVMQTPEQIGYWKAVGANPTPLDWSEVYISLQQGAIDANEQPEDFIRSAKLYEVQKYMFETRHLLQMAMLFMNKDTYEKLPDDLKAAVDESAKETLEQGRQASDARLEKNREFLRAQGMKLVPASPELLADMKQRAQAVNDGTRKKLSKDLNAALDSALADAK